MMRRFLLLFILLLFTPVVMAIEEVTTMPDFTDIPDDVQPIYYGESLLGDEWLLFSIQQSSYHVNVNWYDGNAVVVVGNLEFSSYRDREDYRETLDSTHLDGVMEQYSPYTIENQCRYSDTVLFEMEASNNNNNVDYVVNYYVRLMDDTPEIWFIGVYFPVDRAHELVPLSALFFPDFTSCRPTGDV